MTLPPVQVHRTRDRKFRRQKPWKPFDFGPSTAYASVRGTSTYFSTATETTTVGLALPANWQINDVIYIGWELTATNGSVTTPGGWSAVVPGFAASGVTNAHHGVLRKVMQLGDVAPTITFTSGRFAAALIAVQNADTVTPEDVTPTTDANVGVTTPSVIAPPISPINNSCLILTFHAVRNGTNAASTSFTPDPSETEQADVSSAVAAISNAAIEAATFASDANSTTAKTATATGTVSSINQMGSTVAIRGIPIKSAYDGPPRFSWPAVFRRSYW